MGQAIGPHVLGSILKSNGYKPAFIIAGAGLFTVAIISRHMFTVSLKPQSAG
jgi:hypothetical protein